MEGLDRCFNLRSFDLPREGLAIGIRRDQNGERLGFQFFGRKMIAAMWKFSQRSKHTYEPQRLKAALKGARPRNDRWQPCEWLINEEMSEKGSPVAYQAARKRI